MNDIVKVFTGRGHKSIDVIRRDRVVIRGRLVPVRVGNGQVQVRSGSFADVGYFPDLLTGRDDVSLFHIDVPHVRIGDVPGIRRENNVVIRDQLCAALDRDLPVACLVCVVYDDAGSYGFYVISPAVCPYGAESFYCWEMPSAEPASSIAFIFSLDSTNA